MKSSWFFALQVSIFGFAPSAFCQALEETTALLNNPTARDAVIQADPHAKQADDQVKGLGLGAAGEAKVYEVSSRILASMSEQNGGDAEKMNAQVQGYMSDPSSMEKDLNPDDRQSIHDLATGVGMKTK